MKGDQMGIRAAYPTPQELPLSNWTWFSLRDYDGAPPEPGQPMPLAGVVPFDAVRLVLARVQLSNWQEHAIDGVIVRTVQARAPARQPLEQALASGFVTTAAFPVHQLPCRTIPSLPDPERL